MSAKMIEKANAFLKARENGSFAVMDENGYPSVSAIWLLGQENIKEIYFSTFVGSNKYNRIQKCNKASLNCHTDFENLTLVGEAEILTDQETKTKCWQEPFAHIYPKGDTDPTYCVIKFTAKRVSLHFDEGAQFNL